MDAQTLSDIIVAHRRAMTLYRKECIPLGRNAIEVMLYAYGKPSITATDICQNLLHCNITQTKQILGILVSKEVLWSYGHGKKGKPKYYNLTEAGRQQVLQYWDFINLTTNP